MKKSLLLSLSLLSFTLTHASLPLSTKIAGTALAAVGTAAVASGALSTSLCAGSGFLMYQTTHAPKEIEHYGELPNAGVYFGGLTFAASGITAITSAAIAYPTIKYASQLLQIPQSRFYIAGALSAAAVSGLFAVMLKKS